MVLPTGTVTFLFTDIERSTRLLALDHGVMRDALVRHHAIVRQAVETHGGIVFETVGDAVYAVFTKPSDAVGAALDAQRALDRETSPAGSLLARMALHSGEIEARGPQHYVGEPLVRCARLLVLGHGGQTLVSGAAATLLDGRIPGGATLRDLGEHRLKDLPRAERVHQLDHADLRTTFPPLLSATSRPNNLPAQLTSFVGRDGELRDLEGRLGRERLLTLTGAGGTGKTRLALTLAERALGDFDLGVWFADLAPVSDPEHVLPTIGAALGIRERPSESLRTPAEPLRALLVGQLRSGRALIVLDNCEHLLDASAATVADLMGACPELRVITTSREPLGLPGEQIYRVPGLAEAAELFVERARAVDPGSAYGEAHRLVIEGICARLDRIPLAIELAAARTRVLSVGDIAARLDDRFRLLTGSRRATARRQQTLRATVEWSHALLDEAERSVWRRLGAFAGGFSLAAAEAVGGDGPISATQVLDVLSSLVDKSLVMVDAAGGEVRYRLLETLREYALERLAESGEADAVRRRHASYFLSLAEERKGLLQARRQREWLEFLEKDRDNFRSAVRWAAEHDLETAVRLGLLLARYIQARGHVAEATFWANTVMPRLGELEPHLRARALNLAGVTLTLRGDYPRATKLQRQALDLFRSLGDDNGSADALRSLGWIAAGQGDDESSLVFYRQSLVHEEAAGRPHGIAESHAGIARVAWRRGDHPTARDGYRRAVAIWRELGDTLFVAGTLQDLAYVELESGDLTQAATLAQEALALNREMGTRGQLAIALNTLANVVRQRGEVDRSIALHAEAEKIARELDSNAILGLTLLPMAEIAYDQGDLTLAGSRLHEAATLFRGLDTYRGVTWCYELAARIAAARDQWERSARLYGATVTTRDRIRLVPPKHVRDRAEETIAATRAALGAERYDALFAEGAALTREQAMAYVLSEEAAVTGTS